MNRSTRGRLLATGSRGVRTLPAAALLIGNWIFRGIGSGRGSCKLILLTGELIPSNVRADFVARGKQLYERAGSEYQKLAGQYEEIASRAGNNPRNVVLDQTMARPPVDKNAPQAPAFNPPPPKQQTERLPQNEGAPPVPGAARSPIDGKWYVPDPNRPGKFLRVDQ